MTKHVDISFLFLANKYAEKNPNPTDENYSWTSDLGQRKKLIALMSRLTGGAVKGRVVHDWTTMGSKSTTQTGSDAVDEWVDRHDTFLILDRNAAVQDLGAFITDVKTSIADDNLVIVVNKRGTTNTVYPVGEASQSIEEGHAQDVAGSMALGGGSGEAIGTGWGNLVKNLYWKSMLAVTNPAFPTAPLSDRSRAGRGFWDNTLSSLFGLIGFIPAAMHISEDKSMVEQTIHTMIALGGRPRIARSRAFWHKIRESYSYLEWFSAFPRWSGGWVQLANDPMLQKIQDEGPQSIYAKDFSDNSGRFFYTAPHGLLFSFFVPIAIIYGFFPFVGVNVVFALLGTMFNQVLTFNGLLAYMEAHGFHQKFAIPAAVLAGIVTGNPAITLIAYMLGGFVVGLFRWLKNRPRDFFLFATQQAVHFWGQMERQTLRFNVSGIPEGSETSVEMRAPMHQKYTALINLKVVWRTSFALFGLILQALTVLNMLNMLMLLPSLLFALGLFLGPFVMKTPEGQNAGYVKQMVTTAAAWAAGLGIYEAAWCVLAPGGPILVSLSWLLKALPFLTMAAWIWLIFPLHQVKKKDQAIIDNVLGTEGMKSPDPDSTDAKDKAALKIVANIKNFNAMITAEQFRDKLAPAEQDLLTRVQALDPTLTLNEYVRLNQALWKIFAIQDKPLDEILPPAAGYVSEDGFNKAFGWSGRRIFKILMKQGYFEENSGFDGYVEPLIGSMESKIWNNFPAQAEKIVVILQAAYQAGLVEGRKNAQGIANIRKALAAYQHQQRVWVHEGIYSWIPVVHVAQRIEKYGDRLKQESRLKALRLYDTFWRHLTIAVLVGFVFALVSMPGMLTLETISGMLSVPWKDLLLGMAMTVGFFVVSGWLYRITSSITNFFVEARYVSLRREFKKFEKEKNLVFTEDGNMSDEIIGKAEKLAKIRALFADVYIFLMQKAAGYANQRTDTLEDLLYSSGKHHGFMGMVWASVLRDIKHAQHVDVWVDYAVDSLNHKNDSRNFDKAFNKLFRNFVLADEAKRDFMKTLIKANAAVMNYKSIIANWDKKKALNASQQGIKEALAEAEAVVTRMSSDVEKWMNKDVRQAYVKIYGNDAVKVNTFFVEELKRQYSLWEKIQKKNTGKKETKKDTARATAQHQGRPVTHPPGSHAVRWMTWILIAFMSLAVGIAKRPASQRVEHGHAKVV
ncbi:MAG: hypothetical protein WCI27_10155, partial [Candidatus Omnitrophota bacterium]